jgi:hypothetical protein
VVENKGEWDVIKIPSVMKFSFFIYSNSEHADVSTNSIVIVISVHAWHVTDDTKRNPSNCIEGLHAMQSI